MLFIVSQGIVGILFFNSRCKCQKKVGTSYKSLNQSPDLPAVQKKLSTKSELKIKEYDTYAKSHQKSLENCGF